MIHDAHFRGMGWPRCQLGMFSCQHICALSCLNLNEAMTYGLQHFKVMHAEKRWTDQSFLMHCYSNPFEVLSESRVVAEKEVCRLEISGGQLLLSCGPEHFSNLVYIL